MKVIKVEGNEVLVDDEDYLYLINFYDLKINGKYVQCIPKGKYVRMGLFKGLQLQKLLMNPYKTGRSTPVDHRDGNELNNQKNNLRVCSHAENMRNRKQTKLFKNKPPTSKYKGVCWHKRNEDWEVRIKYNNKYICLGRFNNEIAAANCYNYWAPIYHGEYARLNDLTGIEMHVEEWQQHKRGKIKTSRYHGVSLIEGKWVAQIWDNKNKKGIRVGSFKEEMDAANAYDNTARKIMGDRAKLNFPNK
ncbi:HNH endonuclease [Paenibacillus sp. GCM10027627]|uniref:HNH endonuclease n=1 Tax=unclassified Paenibacillus TaxID=185978 RepID=UPI00363CDD3B